MYRYFVGTEEAQAEANVNPIDEVYGPEDEAVYEEETLLEKEEDLIEKIPFPGNPVN